MPTRILSPRFPLRDRKGPRGAYLFIQCHVVTHSDVRLLPESRKKKKNRVREELKKKKKKKAEEENIITVVKSASPFTLLRTYLLSFFIPFPVFLLWIECLF